MSGPSFVLPRYDIGAMLLQELPNLSVCKRITLHQVRASPAVLHCRDGSMTRWRRAMPLQTCLSSRRSSRWTGARSSGVGPPVPTVV